VKYHTEEEFVNKEGVQVWADWKLRTKICEDLKSWKKVTRAVTSVSPCMNSGVSV
jgi:hypothetical protein